MVKRGLLVVYIYKLSNNLTPPIQVQYSSISLLEKLITIIGIRVKPGIWALIP